MGGVQITLTLILIIFTCIISYQAFNNSQMKAKFLMHPSSVNEFGQYYRFLTSGFLHANWMHLGVNMWVLYVFGEPLELFFLSQFGELAGRLLFLLLYFGAIIFSSIPAFLKHRNNQYYSALGASGGVAAILFALLVISPWSKLNFIFLPGIKFYFIVFGLVYLFYESYMSKKGNDNIGHDAHLAGAVFGFTGIILISFLMKPELIDRYIYGLMHPPFLN